LLAHREAPEITKDKDVTMFASYSLSLSTCWRSMVGQNTCKCLEGLGAQRRIEA
jgi:hypothetical protein